MDDEGSQGRSQASSAGRTGDDEIGTAGGPSASLLAAVRRLLGPLVRLLLEHQVPFPALAALLKSVYVEQASRHFRLPDRPLTQSRITLLTGIHRKDVKRLQAETSGAPETPANVSLGAQIVLRWTADPRYRDPTRGDTPLALPRLDPGGEQPSFEELVESVTTDIRPRAILDEWLRLGIARLDDEDRVHLSNEAFVPTHGFDEKAYYLGRNVHDHLAAARHNLAGEHAPLLERSVYYAKLSPESVAELEALSRRVGSDALQTINRRAHELQQSDARGAADPKALTNRHRINFGVYFFGEATEGERNEDSPDRDSQAANVTPDDEHDASEDQS